MKVDVPVCSQFLKHSVASSLSPLTENSPFRPTQWAQILFLHPSHLLLSPNSILMHDTRQICILICDKRIHAEFAKDGSSQTRLRSQLVNLDKCFGSVAISLVEDLGRSPSFGLPTSMVTTVHFERMS